MKGKGKPVKKPPAIKVDLSKSWCTWVTIGFGINVWALFVPAWPAPLGLVWGICMGGKKTKFNVFGSFVCYFARRQGVRTKINEAILANGYDLIYSTPSREDSSGLEFMKATGYRYLPQMDEWVLTKKPRPPKARQPYGEKRRVRG